ncbi:MAG TPA: isoprenylcysteine carboxylmethyltransferase family protein [Candidatus Dormibacteraeota bacterium]|nr:isoprenylcysteine carboxylmethyltransferase family protein [Candidatus Dormibacteraeota bacterium]
MNLPSLGSRGEGWVVLQFVCLALVAAGGLLYPGFVPGDDLAVLRLVGDLLVVCGLALVAWAIVALQPAKAFTAVPLPRADGALVETGPYRFVRHPVYSGLILAGIGGAVARASLAAGVATIALALVLELKRRREEQWLVERYTGYTAYRARTKALIPFVY